MDSKGDNALQPIKNAFVYCAFSSSFNRKCLNMFIYYRTTYILNIYDIFTSSLHIDFMSLSEYHEIQHRQSVTITATKRTFDKLTEEKT